MMFARKALALTLPAAFLLSACGGNSPADDQAQALEEAAEQSTPEAANVLMNQADQIESGNVTDPAAAQQALDAAGNAQVAGPPPANGQ